MKKRIFSLLLTLVLCLGLLPAASAAEANRPDWYFLFAIFKNVDAECNDRDSNPTHAKYTMTQEEIDFIKNEEIPDFEQYMNQVGVMRAHVDVVEIDTTIKELKVYSGGGSYLSPELAAPLLEGKVDLDKYDHVFCITSLNVYTSYLGLTGVPFENGTGQSCINLVNRDYCLRTLTSTEENFPASMYVHEFLHFMEQMDKKWGMKFELHDIRINFYMPDDDGGKGCYTDIILNRAKGDAGTGVLPVVWQHSPCVLRTMRELTVPSGVTGIGDRAFSNFTGLTKVSIPGSVASLGYCAFLDCTGLTEVTVSSGVPAIGDWVFGRCTALAKVTIPASVTSIGECAFYKTALTDVYYGGTEAQWKAIQIDAYNDALTKANIHYSSGAGTPAPAVTVEDIPASGTAYASTQNININGKAVKFDAYALKNANGDETNYVKLRDVAVALNGTAAQFEVGYDGTISLTTKSAYTGGSDMGTPFSGDRAYHGGAQSVKVNGQPVNMTAITLQDSNGDDYNYFKLRDLGAVLGFTVGYSNETGISINTGR